MVSGLLTICLGVVVRTKSRKCYHTALEHKSGYLQADGAGNAVKDGARANSWPSK